MEDWVMEAYDTGDTLMWKKVKLGVAHMNSLSIRELQRRWPRLRSSFQRIQRTAIQWHRQREALDRTLSRHRASLDNKMLTNQIQSADSADSTVS
jgi:hypothetical protein